MLSRQVGGDSVGRVAVEAAAGDAVEGNVCRVKAIKRSRYGHAKLDLLRKIILCAE